jgi:hypothetical protein
MSEKWPVTPSALCPGLTVSVTYVFICVTSFFLEGQNFHFVSSWRIIALCGVLLASGNIFNTMMLFYIVVDVSGNINSPIPL